jgi:hypothetical protein
MRKKQATGAGGRREPEDTGDTGDINIEELVRRKAYDFFERRGRAPGDPVEDWLRAEREVRGEGRDRGEAAGEL